MAHYSPTPEVLKYYEDLAKKNDPDLYEFFHNWDDLPFPAQFEDPEWYLPQVSRKEWGALPAKAGAEPLTTPVMYIRYTWVGEDDCDSVEACSKFLRKLQETSLEKGLPDIPYNFFIGGKGIVYEGRGWDYEADREQRYNEFEGLHGPLKGKTVDVAYIGDMSFYGPNNDLAMAAAHFIKYYWKKGKIDGMFEVIPYRDMPKGNIAPENYLRSPHERKTISNAV